MCTWPKGDLVFGKAIKQYYKTYAFIYILQGDIMCVEEQKLRESAIKSIDLRNRLHYKDKVGKS